MFLNYVIFSVLALMQFSTVTADEFGPRTSVSHLHDKDIDDASGLAASRVHDRILYAHNDKGDKSRIFAVHADSGKTLAVFNVLDVRNYDWEDIAVGPCAVASSQSGTGSCIYVADIGDHHQDGAKNVVYMIEEPVHIVDSDVPVLSTLQFTWTEIDSNTIFVDPKAEVYIASSVVGGRATLAKLPKTGWGAAVPVAIPDSNTAVLRLNTGSSQSDPRGGDLSKDGKELLFVCGNSVFYYTIQKNVISTVQTTSPVKVMSYHPEANTEAIAWRVDQQGFYTVAEGQHSKIYFYPRTNPAVVG